MKTNKAFAFFQKYVWQWQLILLLYIAVTIIATAILLHLPPKSFNGNLFYTHYNNYIIFRNFFYHLIHHQDLYQPWLHENQYDLFKYSPTFAVFFSGFAFLPDWIGCVLWNLLNVVALFFAIKSIRAIDEPTKIFLWLFIFFEMLTSIQNTQSNGLIAALIIWAVNFLEKRNPMMASLLICLTVFIKIFGLVTFLVFIFYSDKKKFIGFSILWMMLLCLAPLLFISSHQLLFLYKSWGNMLAMDHAASDGFSIMGWLKVWLGIASHKVWIVAIGALIQVLPLLRFKSWKAEKFRWYYVASLLVWMVIFNHKAESPTFIIAVAGVGVWFFISEMTVLNILLAAFVFILTTLSPTDLFPAYLRIHFVIPYMLKVFPCMLVWFKLQYDLNTFKIPLADNR